MISAWALVVYAPASSLFAKFGGLHRCCLKPGTSCLCRGFNCCQQMGSWRRWRKYKQSPPSLLEYHHQAQTFMFTNQAPMWSHAINNSFCFSVLSLLLTIYIHPLAKINNNYYVFVAACKKNRHIYVLLLLSPTNSSSFLSFILLQNKELAGHSSAM